MVLKVFQQNKQKIGIFSKMKIYKDQGNTLTDEFKNAKILNMMLKIEIFVSMN